MIWLASFLALAGWIVAAICFRAYRQAAAIALSDEQPTPNEVGDALLDLICASLTSDPHQWRDEDGALIHKDGLKLTPQGSSVLAERGSITALMQGKRAARVIEAAQTRNTLVLADAFRMGSHG